MASQEIYKDEGTLHALETLWRLPLLYLAVLVVRGICIVLLNPLFKLAGTGVPYPGRIAASGGACVSASHCRTLRSSVHGHV